MANSGNTIEFYFSLLKLSTGLSDRQVTLLQHRIPFFPGFQQLKCGLPRLRSAPTSSQQTMGKDMNK